MSYLNKKYVSVTGTDFTPYINTEEDARKFEEMNECEKRCNAPLKECIEDVVKALNMGRELMGISAKVHHIKGPASPTLN